MAGLKPLARDNPSRADASVRERDEAVGMADINARPPNEREEGNCRDRIATHTERAEAGG